MTAVLPAWKVELMEKKKRKVQDQKQHIESESVHKTSIPEWKRSLLEKRKDSPEAREQPSCVNSIFGPRIVKRSSQTSLSISSVRQEPSGKDGDEMDKANIQRDGALINNSSPGLGTKDTNSSVAKAVEFTSEMDHKTNKHHSQKETKICRDNTQQVETTETSSEKNGLIGESPQPESSVNYEHVKRPSDLRRLFGKSHLQVDKGLGRTQPAKRTESNDVQITKNTEETVNAVEIVQNESQMNKNAEDNAQSIRIKKSQVTSGAPSVGSKQNFASSQFIPKPYKSFVSTPPWLRNTTNRNVSFQVNGTKSVQENDLVGTGIQQIGVDSVDDAWPGAQNDTVHSSSVNADRITKSTDSDGPITSQKTYTQETKGEGYSLMTEFGSKEQQPLRYLNQSNRELNKFIEKYHATEKAAPVLENVNTNLKPVSDTSTQDCTDVSKSSKLHKSMYPADENILHKLNLQGTTRPRYSLEKEPDKEDQELFKPRKESESMKYTVIDRKSWPENVPKGGEENLPSSVNSVVHTTPGPPLELFSQHDGMQATSPTSKSSIESLRSKFGPSGGFHKRSSSEENLLQAENKASQSFGNVTLRQAHGRRPPPPMKRWSADVINLMSQDLDDDLVNLSPTSDSKKSSPSGSFSRGRSSSLFDVHEESGMDFFQHKAGVSQGIEHRMNKLIRKASMSELHLQADDKEDSDSLSDDNEMPSQVSDVTAESDVLAGTESALLAKSSLAPAPDEQEIKEVFVHKHSISSDTDERVSELLHLQVWHSEGEGTEEELISETDSKVNSVHVVTDASKQTDNSEVVKGKEDSKNDYTRLSDDTFTSKDTKEADQNVSDSKLLKGSVHKLSALFGASIRRSSKEDKNGSEVKVKDDMKLQKDSTTEREESKISNLFMRKAEKKSSSTEKQSSNGSIFPWLKKNEMVKEVTQGQRIRNTDKAKDDTSNLSCGGNENLFLAAQSLRPVRKEKVEHKIVGNLVLISQRGTSQEHLPPKGVYHMNKPSSPASQDKQPVKNDVAATVQKEKVLIKPLDKEVEKKDKVQIPTVITQQWNGKEERYEVHGEGTVIDEVPITSIDEVPVSAIDIPESADNDVTVSVIDVPASPDVYNTFFDSNTPEVKSLNNDVNVSVIDMPSPSSEEPPSSFQAGYLESDELSDDSNEDETEGSYDFTTGESQHLVNGFGEDSSDGDEEEGSEEEDGDGDDDDFEDVPISYIGAIPCYPIPQVVFDSEPVQLKSCLSPKSSRKKVNSKVSFKSTHTVHDYPSEESAAVLHDELKEKTAEVKTLQNYQPAGLASMEMMIGQLGKINTVKPHVTNGTKEGTVNNNNTTNSSELKYADDGQAFTDSTNYASALLF